MTNDLRVIHTRGPWKDKTIELIALMDDHDRFIQVQIEDETTPSYVGNVYIGRVQKVIQNINAAFIELDRDLIAYLSLEDAKHIIFTKKNGSDNILCQGDELIVQVMKDPIKTKNAVCTCNISFYQKDVILTSGKRGCGVSRKISQGQREQIKQCFSDTEKKDYGIVFRTSASSCELDDLRHQVTALEQEYNLFCEKSMHLTCFSLLRERESLLFSFLQQLPQREIAHIAEIICDDKEVFEQIPAEFSPRLYKDSDYSLWKLYGIEHKLEKACHPQVWMDSGAYLVIEQTEALTVIDVNTGKNMKKKSTEDYIMEVNKEACVEIAHQLRLRNISGIIIVDFINLKSVENQQQLLAYLRTLVSDDAIAVQVLDYTKLGLVEMTRKKVRATLQQQLGELGKHQM